MKLEEARMQKEMRRKAMEQKQAILDQENEINQEKKNYIKN